MIICDKNHIQIVFCGTQCPLCAVLKDTHRVIEARKVLVVLRETEDAVEAATRGYSLLEKALE